MLDLSASACAGLICVQWENRMSSKYDEQLLLNFVNRFLGYGSLQSKLWSIGPEAGGGENIGELYKRALVWSQRGFEEIEDLQKYHRALGIDWTKTIQRTWVGLIRVILALHGERYPDRERVTEFQRVELGRRDGQNCVLDLSGMSSPTGAMWIPAEFGFDWLATRENFEAMLLPNRCSLLREKIAAHKPDLVLFYGLRQRPRWEEIPGCQLSNLPGLERLSVARFKGTLFAIMPHPTRQANKFLADVGEALRLKLGRPSALE